MTSSATAKVVDRINRSGPISFSEYLDVVLYDPEVGFYATGGRAGRRGDFITSPEVGPLFGKVLGRAIDQWWSEMGEPDPFFVVEVGAGAGVLARSILDSDMKCTGTLRYLMIEQSAALRDAENNKLALEPSGTAFGPRSQGEDPEDEPTYEQGVGPIVSSLAELPAVPLTGIILANELLDNLPFDMFRREGETWVEVRIAASDSVLTEVTVPASGSDIELLNELVWDAPDTAVVPLQRRAQQWVRDALSTLEEGRVVAFDYADTTKSMANQADRSWLRTYSEHERGFDPLETPGQRDVTTDVAIDQLMRSVPTSRCRSQAEFLKDYGIDEMVTDAKGLWQERAGVGDLEALKARSVVNEAQALCDPKGLGFFTVAEWQK